MLSRTPTNALITSDTPQLTPAQSLRNSSSDGARKSSSPKSKQKYFRPVEPGVAGVVQAIDALTMETTGSFIHGNYGNGLKPCPW